jgi:NAD(P)-dependent dehydrogenase (short-subunit alcohol dehydrogenase family)
MIAFVTGGQRGFGRALVEELLHRGATKVYATSRSPFDAWDERIVPLVLDVTDPDAVAQAAATASDATLVINNAGVDLNTPVLTASVDDIAAELDTNLWGLLHVSRAFAPQLAGGTLVNVLSVLSWVSFGRGYEISKSAAWSATNALRRALPDTLVTAVHVGYMETDMTEHVDAPKSDPREIARTVLDAVAAGEVEVVADEISRAVKAGLSEGAYAAA